MAPPGSDIKLALKNDDKPDRQPDGRGSHSRRGEPPRYDFERGDHQGEGDRRFHLGQDERWYDLVGPNEFCTPYLHN